MEFFPHIFIKHNTFGKSYDGGIEIIDLIAADLHKKSRHGFLQLYHSFQVMISWIEILTRLLAAALFGAVVGLERERKKWSSAGMRTHMMVCVGSSLIMMVSAFGFTDVLMNENVSLDPSRVAAQVITGIGFIGAGTIVLLKQTEIKGLTTAAGLWTVAAIGLATGGGMYFAAGVTTAMALLILWALQPLEKKIMGRFEQRYLQFTTAYASDIAEMMGGLLFNKHVDGVHNSLNEIKNENCIRITFVKIEEKEFAEIIRSLQSHAAVKEISWGNGNKMKAAENEK